MSEFPRPSTPEFGFDAIPGTCAACGIRAAEIPMDVGGATVWYCVVCVPRRRLPKSSYPEHVGKPCPYCGRVMSMKRPQDFPSLDHRISRFVGGSDAPSNLLIVCSRCNVVKATMTDAEFREFKKLLGESFDDFSEKLFFAARARATGRHGGTE